MSKAGERASASFYKGLHWGLGHRETLELDNLPLLPKWTSTLGRPERLQTSHFQVRGRKLSKGYLLVNPGRRRDLFIVGSAVPNVRGFPQGTLSQIAAHAGGRRAKWAYPDVLAYDLGPMYHIDYIAEKGTRNEVLYLHEVLDRGEGKPRAKHRCHLCWDGRMYWVLGGDYDVTSHGIVG